MLLDKWISPRFPMEIHWRVDCLLGAPVDFHQKTTGMEFASFRASTPLKTKSGWVGNPPSGGRHDDGNDINAYFLNFYDTSAGNRIKQYRKGLCVASAVKGTMVRPPIDKQIF